MILIFFHLRYYTMSQKFMHNVRQSFTSLLHKMLFINCVYLVSVTLNKRVFIELISYWNVINAILAYIGAREHCAFCKVILLSIFLNILG